MANLKITLVKGFQGRKDDQIATAHSLVLIKFGNRLSSLIMQQQEVKSIRFPTS